MVLVKNGTYRNPTFGNGGKNNGAALSIQNKHDVLLANFPGHSPLIEFDGSGGISMSGKDGAVWLLASLVRIRGPNISRVHST